MKLAKIPDRTPVKMTVTLAPSLVAMLRDYAQFYAQTFGSRKEATDLIAFMLEAFQDGDADFGERVAPEKFPVASLGSLALKGGKGERRASA